MLKFSELRSMRWNLEGVITVDAMLLTAGLGVLVAGAVMQANAAADVAAGHAPREVVVLERSAAIE